MKKIVLFVLAVCAFPKAFSQELNLPQQNQYLADSEFLIAPTYAGIGDFVRIRLFQVIKNILETQKCVRLWQRLLRVLSLWNDFISRMVVSRKLLQRGLICLTRGV